VLAFGVDLLFNNAGTAAQTVDLDAHDLATWNAVVAVNLTGAFLCTREAFRDAAAGASNWAIINSSISAHTPRPRSVAYRHQARDHRPDESRPRWTADRDIAWPDRRRQRGRRAGRRVPPGPGRRQRATGAADGRGRRGQAVCYIASLPLDANVAA
jgi:hypothetical protein